MLDTDYTKGQILFEEDNHKVIWLGWEKEEGAGAIQTNQYLVVHGTKGILLDPGGVHLFPRVVAIISRYIDIDNIETILFSHQDPDVSSGIALWLGVTKAEIYISELWMRFVPHFGLVDFSRLKGIADAGGSVHLSSGADIEMLPAHYLHSPGNFSFFDPLSGILFSSDIGGAVFPDNEHYLYVDNFETHLPLIEGFHQRLMTSNKVCANWAGRMKEKQVAMIAPQHGAVYRGESVNAFFSWLSGLKCGSDILEKFI